MKKLQKELKSFYSTSDSYLELLDHGKNPRQLSALSSYANFMKRWISPLSKVNQTDSGRTIRVLDLGCGTGYSTSLLGGIGCMAVGLDISHKFLAAGLKALPSPPILVTGDALSLPFKDSSFDIVCSHEFIEHITDVPKVITEMKSLLRSGGLLIILSPNILSPIANGLNILKMKDLRRSLNHIFLFSLKVMGLKHKYQYLYPELKAFKNSDDDLVYMSNYPDLKRALKRLEFIVKRNGGMSKNRISRALNLVLPGLSTGIYLVAMKK